MSRRWRFGRGERVVEIEVHATYPLFVKLYSLLDLFIVDLGCRLRGFEGLAWLVAVAFSGRLSPALG
jgi:hypothetical protein